MRERERDFVCVCVCVDGGGKCIVVGSGAYRYDKREMW